MTWTCVESGDRGREEGGWGQEAEGGLSLGQGLEGKKGPLASHSLDVFWWFLNWIQVLEPVFWLFC